jgi:hypothetical protein
MEGSYVAAFFVILHDALSYFFINGKTTIIRTATFMPCKLATL